MAITTNACARSRRVFQVTVNGANKINWQIMQTKCLILLCCLLLLFGAHGVTIKLGILSDTTSSTTLASALLANDYISKTSSTDAERNATVSLFRAFADQELTFQFVEQVTGKNATASTIKTQQLISVCVKYI